MDNYESKKKKQLLKKDDGPGLAYHLVEALTNFDWITPGIGLVEDLINDPTLFQSNSWTFFVPYEDCLAAGYNAVDIKRLLNDRGIHHWGSQITGRDYFFSVSLEDADAVATLLAKNNIPACDISELPAQYIPVLGEEQEEATPKEAGFRSSTPEERRADREEKKEHKRAAKAKKVSGKPKRWLGIDW